MMNTAQRVSRGFHRLGLVLAAIPLLAAILFMTYLFDLGWVANKANGVSFHDYLILFIPTWELVRKLAVFVAIPPLVSLAVYIVVRAIGWVIGGFAAS